MLPFMHRLSKRDVCLLPVYIVCVYLMYPLALVATLVFYYYNRACPLATAITPSHLSICYRRVFVCKVSFNAVTISKVKYYR